MTSYPPPGTRPSSNRFAAELSSRAGLAGLRCEVFRMAISSALTFRYQFSVRESVQGKWAGEGTGAAHYGQSEGLVGPNPRFELCSGWLTLYPTGNWTQSFPSRAFYNPHRLPQEMTEAARVAEVKTHAKEWAAAHHEALQEVAAERAPWDFAAYLKRQGEAMAAALRRHGLTRDLAAYSIFVGDALGIALRIGDAFEFSRNGGGDFGYRVVRDSETVLSAGLVGSVDGGGPMAVWQEHDRRPNPHAEDMKMKFPQWPIADWIDEPKQYVTARIKEQVFRLLDDEEAHIDQYYVFLVRSNRKLDTSFEFGFAPRAVHGAGRLDHPLRKELIIDAARHLSAPQVRLR